MIPVFSLPCVCLVLHRDDTVTVGTAIRAFNGAVVVRAVVVTGPGEAHFIETVESAYNVLPCDGTIISTHTDGRLKVMPYKWEGTRAGCHSMDVNYYSIKADAVEAK